MNRSKTTGYNKASADLLLKICQELRIELNDLKSEDEIDLTNSKLAISKFSKGKNINKLDLKIGPKIKAFRRQLGLQANKFAEQLNISPSYLNLIESSKRKIDGDLLIKISKELRVNLSDMAAMGAKPVFYNLALSIPKEKVTKFIPKFVKGLEEDQKTFDLKLIGGDLTSSLKHLNITITIFIIFTIY